MNRAAQVGVGFLGLGFLVLFIAWNGAAEQDCPECQIPYLLSGGAVGIGLIIVGAALLLFESARRDRVHLETKLEEIRQTLEHGVVASSNGTSSHAVAAPTAPVPSVDVDDPSVVVLGRASYHRTDCRLVEGKEDLEYGDRSIARDQGLEPCRVCDPDKTPTSGSGRSKKR